VKITLDFGVGKKRRYTLGEKAVNTLKRGEHLVAEFCHPYFGEVFIIKPKKEIYGRSPGLYHLAHYCCDVINGKVKIRLKPVKLRREQNSIFKRKLAEEIAKQIKPKILKRRR